MLALQRVDAALGFLSSSALFCKTGCLFGLTFLECLLRIGAQLLRLADCGLACSFCFLPRFAFLFQLFLMLLESRGEL